MKISIVYVSQGGNTEVAAEYSDILPPPRFPFVQVKLMSIRDDEVDYEFLQQSEAVIFGTPVYCAGMSWGLKKCFDLNVRLDLEGHRAVSNIRRKRCRKSNLIDSNA